MCRTTEGPTVITNYTNVHKRAKLCALALKGLGFKWVLRGFSPLWPTRWVTPLTQLVICALGRAAWWPPWRGTQLATWSPGLASWASEQCVSWASRRPRTGYEGWSLTAAAAAAAGHTLNPRLSDKDLKYIINDAQDGCILSDITFAAALERILPDCPTIQHIVFLTDRSAARVQGGCWAAGVAGLLTRYGVHKVACLWSACVHMAACLSRIHVPVFVRENMPVCKVAGKAVLCYEELLAACMPSLPGFKWTEVDEQAACGLCYTSGTTGAPKVCRAAGTGGASHFMPGGGMVVTPSVRLSDEVVRLLLLAVAPEGLGLRF